MKNGWAMLALMILGLGCTPDLGEECKVDSDCDGQEYCVAGVCVEHASSQDSNPAAGGTTGDSATTDGATPVDDGQLGDAHNSPRDGGADMATDAMTTHRDANLDPDMRGHGGDGGMTADADPRADHGAGGNTGDSGHGGNIPADSGHGGTGGAGGSMKIDAGIMHADTGTGGEIPDARVMTPDQGVMPADAQVPVTDALIPTPDAFFDLDAAPGCMATGDEVCDGLDNDCDGEFDEEFPEDGQRCLTNLLGICTSGFFTCNGALGLDCEQQLMPRLVELCDGLDDNCDGQIDEDYPELGSACATGVGLCRVEGRTVCGLNGLSTRCNAVAREPAVETCDGLDNNCNGDLDERNGGGPLTQICYSGPDGTDDRGICLSGERRCQNGVFGACQGEITPAVETCDGTDEDCDGQVDNDVLGVGMACNTGLLGICANGTTSCDAVNHRLVCRRDTNPGDIEEVCDNGRDDNCNGQTDEGVLCGTCIPTTTQDCYNAADETEGVGVCHHGTQTCVANGLSYGPCQGAVLPSQELCDGLDNNCNADIDEGTGVGTPCSAGIGACQRQGVLECDPVNGGTRCNAVAGQPAAERCDGVDNNCNGQVDEAVNGGPLTQACYTGVPETQGVGTCHGGTQTCANGEFGVCAGEVTPVMELCNSLDEDCDHNADDGFNVGDACMLGQGICLASGHMVCNPDGGDTHCDAVAGQPQVEICDGQDNNCDGQVDEGLLNRCGLCGPLPRDICGNGLDEDCDGHDGSPEICDQVDNDCDSIINEGFNNPPGAEPQCWCRDKDNDGLLSCRTASARSQEEIMQTGDPLNWYKRVPFIGIVNEDADDNSPN